MSTYKSCLDHIKKCSEDECINVECFVSDWLIKNGIDKKTIPAINFTLEKYLDKKYFTDFIEIIKKYRSKIELESLESEIYEKYKEYEFKGGEVDFITKIEKVGSNVSHYTLDKALKENNISIFKNNSARVDAFLKEKLLKIKRDYHEYINSKIKSGNLIWVTWSYEDKSDPFFFLNEIDDVSKKEELINQLALVRKYYINEKNYLLTFSVKKTDKIKRATICDASNSEYFRVGKLTNHGFTVALSNQEIDKENDGSLGRPEGLIQSTENDLKISEIITIL